MNVLGRSHCVCRLQSLGGVDDTTALNDVDPWGILGAPILGQQIIPYPIYAMNIIILVLINY